MLAITMLRRCKKAKRSPELSRKAVKSLAEKLAFLCFLFQFSLEIENQLLIEDILTETNYRFLGNRFIPFSLAQISSLYYLLRYYPGKYFQGNSHSPLPFATQKKFLYE